MCKVQHIPSLFYTVANFINKIIMSNKWDGKVYSNYLIFLIDNMEKLERARDIFYSHDDESLKVFDWRQKSLILQSFFCDKRFPLALEYAPFTNKELEILEEKARKIDERDYYKSYLLDIIDVWILESYRLPGICEVEDGDIVLDCGTYTGNTTKYFSQKVGEKGHVYGFEAGEDTFKEYQNNSKKLGNVTAINAAVSSVNGFVTFSKDDGPGARISKEGNKVKSVSIDNYILSNNIKKVDFIKMDIEGAELAAVKGATRVIEKYRPKMALSAYHKYEDLYNLPEFICSIDKEYSFYLRHFSNNLYETVLFCSPHASENGIKKVEHYEKYTNILQMMKIYGKIAEANYNSLYGKMTEFISLNSELVEKYKKALKENHELHLLNSVLKRKLKEFSG